MLGKTSNANFIFLPLRKLFLSFRWLEHFVLSLPCPPFILWSNFPLWSENTFKPFSLLLHGIQLIFSTEDWNLVEETHESSASGRIGGEGVLSDSSHRLCSFEQPALRCDLVSACWPYRTQGWICICPHVGWNDLLSPVPTAVCQGQKREKRNVRYFLRFTLSNQKWNK